MRNRLTIRDIAQWIDNDEGLYRWFKSARCNKRHFIRSNRAELESAISRVLNGERRAHFLIYG